MNNRPFIDIPPLLRASGTVRLPGSKSISNRVLLLAGLSQGTTVVHDLLDSDDTRVMKEALQALGCTLVPCQGSNAACSLALKPDGVVASRRHSPSYDSSSRLASGLDGGAIKRHLSLDTTPESRGNSLAITGLGGQLAVSEATLFLGNAGTAMRPLTAALALLASTQGGQFELSGVARMHERPIADLVDALRQLGCNIDYMSHEGFPPLRLNPGHGTLSTSQPIRVRGDVSSQFLTALLLALPLVSQAGPCVIEVEGELISKPYIDITLRLLARFGIQVQREGWERFTIAQGSRYQSPGEIHVEGDASAASYFIALGALAATEQPLRIEGVGSDSIQGDVAFVDAARLMGAEVSSGPGWLEVRRGEWPLKAIDLDCNHIPDAAMTLAVMALYAQGTTRLRNIASWRVKETDRIHAMATELRKLGASVTEAPDSIEVTPPSQWHSAAIHTYDDHRMAMCFSLAAFNGLTASAPTLPVRILDPQCVGKTFPEYFKTLFSVVQTDTDLIPVITIDGPTASGKGTVASSVAGVLSYHLLDSGALYRAAALAALRKRVSDADESALAELARGLKLKFLGHQIWLDDEEITDALREESVGAMASRISAWPALREALLQLQLDFRQVPGLVADGRDMGTVIFPDARLKIFLTASAAHRAGRRYKQLILKGIAANIESLREALEARDARDKNRSASPLKPAEDAVLLDNSTLSPQDTVDAVLSAWQQRGSGPSGPTLPSPSAPRARQPLP
jgi:3-phosphoshikimate 1-carboxyvinyltransferase